MLDRRTLLMTAAAGALTGRARSAGPPERLALWPGRPPGGEGPGGSPRLDGDGAVYNVDAPFLEVFAPDRPCGASVLVAGGGGYRRIGNAKEAYPAARWLVSVGITAYVLTYRLPREGWDEPALTPLRDVQRALRVIRARDGGPPGAAAVVARSDRPPLDLAGAVPARPAAATSVAGRAAGARPVGVMGFSAGGHLVGMAAIRAGRPAYEPRDAADAHSARADFAVLVYPVVTLEEPFQRTITCRNLVGENPSQEAAAAWSLHRQVRGDCPPVFLVQAEDDAVINPENSRLLEAACRRAGVSIETCRLSWGGHGFGMGRPGSPSEGWPPLCRAWLAALDVCAP